MLGATGVAPYNYSENTSTIIGSWVSGYPKTNIFDSSTTNPGKIAPYGYIVVALPNITGNIGVKVYGDSSGYPGNVLWKDDGGNTSINTTSTTTVYHNATNCYKIYYYNGLDPSMWEITVDGVALEDP